MATNNYTKYDEDFKKSLVSLYQNGKTQSQLCKEYGVQHLMNEYGYQLPIDLEKDTSLSFDGLQLIPENYQVFRNGKEIVLTGKEFEILMLLAQNRGRVFSKEQIYDAVWNNEYVFDERNMTQLVSIFIH